MSSLAELSLAEMSRGLRAGEFSSRELTQACLQRIADWEAHLHCFLTLTPELALFQADSADQRLSEWRKQPDIPISPLLGIPLVIKDVLCLADVRCTCGSLILQNYRPPYHATAVSRLLAAGMVVLGKTNTDEFAMGSSTENSAYGVTHNPWDMGRVPGGSSGGSAAAVAASLAPLGLGTDTGGSVRQPAAFCGVTGLKPSYGRVSRYGLVAFGSSLDVIGVFGHNAEEIAVLFRHIAGHDPRDATSVNQPLPAISTQPGTLRGLRVGIPAEYFIPGIQPSVERLVKEAISHLEKSGAQLVPIQLPHTEYALPVYYLIAPAEASANLARYDGIRYGPRAEADTLWQVFKRTRGQEFGAEVKRRIMLGTYALSAGYYDAYYGQAQKVRTLILRDFELAFQQVDLIATPSTPNTAFPIGTHSEDPLAMYLEDIFTLPASLAGVPGISFPVGFDEDGLPVGMQLIAAPFREDLLLNAVQEYQASTLWHTRRPKLQHPNKPGLA
jgi:aspartyl-tRNA(Asn)/glutamyl-tRNA(Gln) amidotransferase subunit A